MICKVYTKTLEFLYKNSKYRCKKSPLRVIFLQTCFLLRTSKEKPYRQSLPDSQAYTIKEKTLKLCTTEIKLRIILYHVYFLSVLHGLNVRLRIKYDLFTLAGYWHSDRCIGYQKLVNLLLSRRAALCLIHKI